MDNLNTSQSFNDQDEIAIIGMSGRFPGSKNVDIFWENLRDGVESIACFTDEELVSAGVNPTLLNDPSYVKSGGVLEDIELFDASFFGFSPREAEITDPQHRLFMECVWQALENAGYNSEIYSGSIGLFTGVAISTYLLSNLYPNRDLMESEDSIIIGNEKDFLPTQISYKLNLKGPSINIQTACSTSLVAVHLACQSLMNGESDIVLAGGVSVGVPQKLGYRYQPGGIHSPDGHCRAFDAQAQGTNGGNGLGVVVLKRLEDAIADGDFIHAVIKSSAVNNDGFLKVGYTAPSVEGQRQVILEALALAGVEPETVSYIEAHGTGTILGDPIEIKALTQAFAASTNKKGFCAIGSVKTNIGHLNTAAGVTGLIKTVLALKHQQIPPSLHFQQPNPQIDFANSPFYVNTKLSEWKTNGTPRRAGVSSFGIGGTNAHAILEEAPVIAASSPSRPWQLLLLSAKTSTALETATANLADHFEQNPDINLADVAHTLQVGRWAFEHRRIVVCHDSEDAVKILTFLDSQRIFTYHRKPSHCPVIFMFSGQGAQYANMARELYEVEPTFKKHVDTCAKILEAYLNLDIRSLLYPREEDTETASKQLQQTALTQPALFVIEYALAQLFIEWGIHPQAMIGHSIGEYVAAAIAGVFSLEDALLIVAKRGQLMQQLPQGSMLAVKLPANNVQLLLEENLEIAVINSQSSCVVSGTNKAILQLQKQLISQGIECRLLHTSHAFHSAMMEPIREEFVQLVKTCKLHSPKINFISNVTGNWITDAEATNPNYWGQHLRQTVRFSDGISLLLKQFEGVFLEVGPGRTLSNLTTQHLDKNAKQQVLNSLRHVKEQQSDSGFLLQTLGRLWLFGVDIDWSGFYAHEQRHRLPLPTYPFERQRYWIEPQKQQDSNGLHLPTPASPSKKPDIANWFYIPFWKPSLHPVQLEYQELASPKSCTLVFLDECGLGINLVKQLEGRSHVITVKKGDKFTVVNESQYTINPENNRDYDVLIQELTRVNKLPKKIAHLWSVTLTIDQKLEIGKIDQAQTTGFYSLLYLAQALGKQETTNNFEITVISNNLQPVTGSEVICPEKATLLGTIKVIPQEYLNINCQSIDVILPISGSWQEQKLIENLLAELTAADSEKLIAYRGLNRWVQSFEPVRFDKTKLEKPRLREKGVYLITGGLGGIGFVLAEYLARNVQAKLLLVGRSAFPQRDEWEQWLATHDEIDNISRKIRKVQELENLGAEVLVAIADVSNTEQMQSAIAQAEQQFGSLNGVIHAAGVAGGGVIQRKTQEEAETILAPKVKGTLVINAILKDIQLDFFVLVSSMNSILGGFGQVDYCGANAFLDAFAHCNASKSGTLTTSINWDVWQEVGMAVNTGVPKKLSQVQAENINRGILPHEGVDAFLRALGSTIPQIVISPSDLFNSLNQYNLDKEIQVLELLESVNQFNSKYPRPDLTNDYVAPRTETEQKLAEIWQNVLGIERIGIYDNFFELGGDSLIGIQLIASLNKVLSLNISVAKLYECPNIGSMAKTLTPEESHEDMFEQRLKRGQRRRQLKMQNS
ncbi:MAG: SDR family NAD(P)-dependent oxidoreductase [Nostoc sp. DedVER02]|uniref:type I polyketide synthase n=1 Tax=unclassified Nostoc TaxID=2593658 RepID=UPI002AD2B75E|nr:MULTISPECIES: SDR family NAD(P)-dependent oxidoreductase [unclassified Nostoc]MDZ7985847.1 SDR family NAD(P)-dependent oxidoreductase [Nostoc sp. DedVER02]MDZ8114682.1 SDR family NAD(P)-dependent oxidoreductase [Nostoc sp. DedVER01b]